MGPATTSSSTKQVKHGLKQSNEYWFWNLTTCTNLATCYSCSDIKNLACLLMLKSFTRIPLEQKWTQNFFLNCWKGGKICWRHMWMMVNYCNDIIINSYLVDYRAPIVIVHCSAYRWFSFFLFCFKREDWGSCCVGVLWSIIPLRCLHSGWHFMSCKQENQNGRPKSERSSQKGHLF